MVVTPVKIAITNASAEAPKPHETMDGVFEIAIVDRSEGRQEDPASVWNSFNTGINIQNIPDGFRLVLFDHPIAQASGYSLLGQKIIGTGHLVIDLFKLTEQNQLDLPCFAAYVKIEPIYTFSMPPNIKKEAVRISSRAAKKSSRRKKDYSSSDDEPQVMTRGKTKNW